MDKDVDFDLVQSLSHEFSFSPLTAQVLVRRGFSTSAEIQSFLNHDLTRLPSPFSIQYMDKAVSRVMEAIERNESIMIYGDYDVDGTCGATILYEFFRQCGVSTRVYQPNRFHEGYGIHNAAVNRLIDEGAKVLISVDCGVTALEPARICKERGVDLIIIDHHLPGPVLPDSYAMVNPKQEISTDPVQADLKNLCGAGLAFFFCMALRVKLREKGFFTSERPEPNLKKYLDLVAVATVADLVNLRGINRILVTHGLQILNHSPRPGLAALLEVSQIKRVRSQHLGFFLGPRINAAGRLQSAGDALALLTCQDPVDAKARAEQLHLLNAERRATQDVVWKQAREQALQKISDPRWLELKAKIPGAEFGPWPRALVLAHEDWHEGVVGIVASKILEEFRRPVFIFAKKEGAEVWKGSARSIGTIDIFETMQTPSVREHLLNFGGHAHAGGAALPFSALEKFDIALNEYLALTTSQEQYNFSRPYDLQVSMADYSKTEWERFADEVDRLEPFGMGFPEPTLRACIGEEKNRVSKLSVLKEKHPKFLLGNFETIWFNGDVTCLGEGCSSQLWIRPQWNEWNGRRRLQLQVVGAGPT